MPSSAPNNRRAPLPPFYKRERALREGPDAVRLAICGACVCLCAALSGCGFSIPIKPLAKDDMVTGSIRPAPEPSGPKDPLGAPLTEEDWRRARNAMSVALDPLGNGERTTWENAETGHGGSFRASGLPFARSGEVCRAWSAEVRAGHGAVTREGVACRAPGDDWRIAHESAGSS